MSMILENNRESQNIISAKKLIMWLVIITVVMLFAGLTSAYIVRRAEGNWLNFALPEMFKVSTLVILLSSASLFLCQYFLNINKVSKLNYTLVFTFALGILFLFFQFQSWVEIYNYKVVPGDGDYSGQYFGIVFGGRYSNPSGSFLYVLSGLHFIHIIGGLILMSIVLIKSLTKSTLESVKRWLEMCSLFWHFLGALWIYLYVFLIVYH